MTDEQIIAKIDEFFEHNYEALRLEGAHSMSDSGKRDALDQVKYYFKRLKDIAGKITETEVKLSLPEQTTAMGRKFCIEGVVDIVKEDEEIWMYDIKTHEADFIKANKQLYEQQLLVYSHIWHKLRGNQLDHIAIISTALPTPLKNAIAANNTRQIAYEMKQWEPVIELPVEEGQLEQTIKDFGEVVDSIEEHNFSDPGIDAIKNAIDGSMVPFATRVCRNCDGRFSCKSYWEYARESTRFSKEGFRKYMYELYDDLEQETWINASLDLAKLDINVERPE